MSEELKTTLVAIGSAFEEYKKQNDTRMAALETKGTVDPLVEGNIAKINAELESLAKMKRQLEVLENSLSVANFQGGGGGGPLDKAKAEHKQAWAAFMKKGVDAGLRDLEVKAAASTLSDPDGGFTVPEEVDGMIGRVAIEVSAIRRLSTVRRIGTDTYKKLVGQGGATTGWVAEKDSRAETDSPTLKEIAINTKELYAMPAATQTLLDDSSIDIGAWLAGEVQIAFSEAENEAFFDGNGMGEPMGLNTYPKVANASYAWGSIGYIAGGHATLLNNADKLIDIQHALKSTYRTGASFLMNDLTMSVIRKFKDGDGNYLWRPGLIEGAPDTLLGKPVDYDDNVTDIGAGAYPLWFGNFKRAYLVVDRIGTRVLRDPFTSKPYVLFYTTKRVGAGIVMYEAIKALKIATT